MKRTCSSYRGRFLAVLALVVVVLLPSAMSEAQPSLSLSVGFTLPGSVEAAEVFEDYSIVGFHAAAMVQVPLYRWLLLEPLLSYRLYPYLGNGAVSTIPENPIYIQSGGPLQQLFVGLSLRLQLPTDSQKVVPFVDLGAGYEFERFGRLTEQVAYPAQEYITQPIYSHQWAYTAAAGLRFRLSSRFSLEPSYWWHASGRYNNYGLLSFDLIYALPL